MCGNNVKNNKYDWETNKSIVFNDLINENDAFQIFGKRI